MHRQLVYPGQIPLETDVLSTNKDGYVGLAKLAQALFGNSTTVNGLSAGPTGPASLAVLVQPGEIYSLQQTDTSGYSTLGTDSLQILKQGIITGTTTLNTPAPVTGGFSINYLVQAGFIESDANSVVLPYYNASNPSVAWSGPANSGTPQNTQRQDLCSVTIKAGTAAATGTQATPSPDAGFVGLWVVTVANGQATVTSANISAYPGAPFLHGSQNNPLFAQHNLAATTNPGVSNDNTQGYSIGSRWLNTSTNIMYVAMNVSTGAAVWGNINEPTSLVTSTGSANAQSTTNPVPLKAVAGARQRPMIPGFTNTTFATLAADGNPAATIKAWGQNLIGNELQAGVPTTEFEFDGTNWNLIAPFISARGLLSGALEATIFTANGNFTPLTTGNYLVVAIGGGGGGGSGGASSSAPAGGMGGCGGGGGNIGFSVQSLVGGTAYPVVIGTGGTGGVAPASGSTTANAGNNGNNTTFNGVTIAAGGSGGLGGQGSSQPAAPGISGQTGAGYGGGVGGTAVSGNVGANGAANTGGGGGGGGGAQGTGPTARAGSAGGVGGTGVLIVIRA